jgi:predicted peroxiredoxin
MPTHIATIAAKEDNEVHMVFSGEGLHGNEVHIQMTPDEARKVGTDLIKCAHLVLHDPQSN